MKNETKIYAAIHLMPNCCVINVDGFEINYI